MDGNYGDIFLQSAILYENIFLYVRGVPAVQISVERHHASAPLARNRITARPGPSSGKREEIADREDDNMYWTL